MALEAFQSLANSAYENLPSVRLNSPQEVLRRMRQVAVPAIALASLSALPEADAIGCLGCVICLGAGGGPACIPVCALCLVTIPIPAG